MKPVPISHVVSCDMADPSHWWKDQTAHSLLPWWHQHKDKIEAGLPPGGTRVLAMYHDTWQDTCQSSAWEMAHIVHPLRIARAILWAREHWAEMEAALPAQIQTEATFKDGKPAVYAIIETLNPLNRWIDRWLEEGMPVSLATAYILNPLICWREHLSRSPLVPLRHTCHAKLCRVEVAPRFLMCPRHWRMVPKPLQDEVWRTYRLGQEIRKDPSPAWLSAAQAAIQSVQEAENAAKSSNSEIKVQAKKRKTSKSTGSRKKK